MYQERLSLWTTVSWLCILVKNYKYGMVQLTKKAYYSTFEGNTDLFLFLKDI